MNPKNEKPALSTVKPKRLLMCPDDLSLFFGKLLGQRGIRQHWQTMRDVLGKKKNQRITIREFAEYEGIPLEDVIAMINANDPD